MAVMGGSSAAVVGAPLERVRAFVQDVERAPQWQGGLTAMRALERDEDGRAVLCRAEADARVRTVRSLVRYSYDDPAALAWRQEQGDLKSAVGRWELEDLGPAGRLRWRRSAIHRRCSQGGHAAVSARLELTLTRVASCVQIGQLSPSSDLTAHSRNCMWRYICVMGRKGVLTAVLGTGPKRHPRISG